MLSINGAGNLAHEKLFDLQVKLDQYVKRLIYKEKEFLYVERKNKGVRTVCQFFLMNLCPPLPILNRLESSAISHG